MQTEYDAIVIGAGQAGPPLAVRLAQAGRRVALIERGPLGGTCVNTGCTPTKTMVASARAAHMARVGDRYGVVVGPVSVDYGAVRARRDAIVAEHIKGLESWLSDNGVALVRAHARFSGPRTIVAGGDVLTAPQVFVNAGARPVVPDWPGVGDVAYLTSVTMMDLEVLPEHLVIIGGGYVGLEFAQMFRRFGARVTVIEHGPRLLSKEDPDVSRGVGEVLAAEGIEMVFNARSFTVAREGMDGVAVGCEADGAALSIAGSHLLVATGRRPNSDGLGLEAGGIETDARGFIVVDEQLRSSAEGVWALGEINGRGGFTHTSYNDYEIVAANLLDGGARRVSDRVPAHNLYIDPPLGRVGMSETEARKRGGHVLKGVLPMSRVGGAREKGETQGFMKVLVDGDTGLILGAALFGVECDEVVQQLLPLMTAGVPYTAVGRTMYIHPTVSELLPSLFATLAPLAAA